ncbi:hypothetical protein KPL78_09730 [Roseomonas sp. HJA6]|uniref:Uncharacterized protein n=1 Tax=Roseomonas alba TaxID=2846776 RepID=A0ABS7A743_9PROT|nr:hypothetical protein [Neoroseomonas alba]MBW6398126.1 hypothetical protein [Neoroseomonas alba]
MLRGIVGALMLARGRRDGVEAFRPTLDDARASFLAAFLCLPAFLLLRMGSTPGGEAVDPVRALIGDLLAYVCSWAGFAVASLPIAEAMGRRKLWPRFIAAWNWMNLVQYAVLTLLSLPSFLGWQGMVADTLGLVGLFYAIWMQWFATRLSLSISGAQAAAFVGLDLALSLFLSGLVLQLAQA